MRAEPLPRLSEAIAPPVILGTAALAHAAYAGADFAALSALVAQFTDDEPARRYDDGIACQLAFRRAEGLDLQDEALAGSTLFRVRAERRDAAPLRLLALVSPGDLMVNTPLDFITRFLNVRLDLLHLLPDEDLPAEIPDHDVAFVASSASDPDHLARLKNLFARWPRPILNDPAFLPNTARDTLAAKLNGIPSILAPRCVAVSRTDLDALIGAWDGPVLIRPRDSHAGAGLKRIADTSELRAYLMFSFAAEYFVTAFIDYRGDDGMFRKYRVAFIDRVPHLCHMAVSAHWMVHYLNAGMAEHATRRDDEARAMDEFDTGFAVRHESAFSRLHEVLGFDFYSIDCAETRDGRLLVFEADTAAIIHLMDPPDLFAYKQQRMRRVFGAFDRMLRNRIDAYAPIVASDLAM
jgi:glutathione synthase/RimK-type ligase-like ATP-grasp enzyme